MHFSKYSDMENAYRTNTINKFVEHGVTSGVWQVEEKVHGSNFSIWYDGTDIRCARRSAFLGVDETFNNYQYVVAPLIEKVKSIWSEFPQAGHITLFGEIFGGNYPHPDVEKIKGRTKIQDGVYYTPDNMFYLFDIEVDDKVIDLTVVERISEQYGFFYAKPLFRGTFQECMEYPNDQQSKIAEWLGLPAIEGNIREGVVIKPVEPKYLPNGNRVFLKNKNEKWSEKTHKPKLPKEKIELSELAERILEECSAYFCENRLKNVLSKLGPVTDKDFGKIMKDFQEDAYKDFSKDHEGESEYDISLLDKKEAKVVHKRLCSIGSGLIRSNFVNIIDGIF